MKQWREQLARLKKPLAQEVFGLDPDFQADLVLSNKIDWSFAVLMGRSGSKQVPLACDNSGNLAVTDSTGALEELLSQLTETTTPDGPFYENDLSAPAYLKTIDAVLDGMTAKLTSSVAGTNLADYFDSSFTYPPLYSSLDNYAMADYFDSTLAYPPFYATAGYDSIADVLYDIRTVLEDVWDAGNHWLKVHETT